MTPCTPTKRFTQMAVRAVAVAIVFTCLRAAPAIADDGIEVTLSLPDHILIGEPLPALVRVRNTSDRTRPVMIPIISRREDSSVAFSLERPGAERFIDIIFPDIYIGGMAMHAAIPLPVRHLASGEDFECRFYLVYEFPYDARHRQRLFDVPGKYRLRVSVQEPLDIRGDDEFIYRPFRYRAVQSEAASVEVSMPEDGRDRQALEAWYTLPDEYLAYAPLSFQPDCHKEAIKPFLSFFHEYGDTRLGRRAALPLGVAVAEGLMKEGKHEILEALVSLRQGSDGELSEMASAIFARFPQLDPLFFHPYHFFHPYYAEKPVEMFIDVIRASNTEEADYATFWLSDLTTPQMAFLLLLCERAATTITNQLFCFPQPHASQTGGNWRMELPNERMSWLLCQTFGLEDAKFTIQRDKVDGKRRFTSLVEECVDALAALRKQEEYSRTQRTHRLMEDLVKAINADEPSASKGNGRGETALKVLATNASDQVRTSGANAGLTPDELLASVVVQIVVADQDPRYMDFAAEVVRGLHRSRFQGVYSKDLVLWLASRLCDLRSSPAPGEGTPPPGHDLSLIGGKCAYILEKALMTKLVPVRRDTPIETLNEQRERLMKRINNI